MNDINELFFDLIRVTICNQICLSHTPLTDEWREMFTMAKKQSLVGVCFTGVQRLQKQQQAPPEGLYLQWMGMAAKIQQQYDKHIEVLSVVNRHLCEAGVSPIFIKGLICASRYTQPELRQCGDIDFVLRNIEYRKSLNVLGKICRVDRDHYHEHHGSAVYDGVLLEPHYKIREFHNPFSDYVMKKLQEQIFTSTAYTLNLNGREVRVFSPEFEGVYLICHMVSHFYGEGIGLRQVLDYALWVKSVSNMTNFNCELYHSYLNKLHMTRAAKIFTKICVKFMPEEYIAFNYQYSLNETRVADKILIDIMQVGNFGNGLDHTKKTGIMSYLWTCRRALFFRYLCPNEAYWLPFGKFYRYLVRRIYNGNIKRKLLTFNAIFI